MAFQNNNFLYNNVSLTKDIIKDLLSNNPEEIVGLVEKNINNSGNLIFILESFGHIPKTIDLSFLVNLTMHENESVRFLAVKNLGKLKSKVFLNLFYVIYENDKSTKVKREAVSSIGRIKQDDIIPNLITILQNSDPKIVCQAIRGLLPYKQNSYVEVALKGLIDHENEMVRAVIEKEFYAKKIKSVDALKHPVSYKFLQNVAVEGDVRNILSLVPDNSIHLTFTSPPYYNARDYSIYPSYEAYLDFLSEVFQEVHRATKEGRFLIVNTSPVIVPRISRAHSSKRYPIPFDLHARLVNMGWEFIDDIVWMKPEYSVKNRVGGFQQHRKPLAYKPNAVTEYLMVYRKKTDKLLDWNIHQYSNEIVANSKVESDFETTNVWAINPKSDKVHSAVFPEELCERVIKYYSYIGDLLFDPFAGSGTFGRTAAKLNRKFFLAEQDHTYFEYIQSNMRNENVNKDFSFLTFDEFKESIKL